MIQNGSKRQKPVVSRHCWNMYPDLKQIYIARCEFPSHDCYSGSPQIPCKAESRRSWSHEGLKPEKTKIVDHTPNPLRLSNLGRSDTHAPVPWVDHGNDYGVGVQGDKKKWNTHEKGKPT
ncbi:hypothetical protein H9L39_08951 [Fusarium oxysporum f. sp. albedinis]|nr:hypothetical protein H9L39_08951 [Fusarium oxysporum f. sp. albedinis]